MANRILSGTHGKSGQHTLRADGNLALTSVINTTFLATFVFPKSYTNTPILRSVGTENAQGCFIGLGIAEITPSQVVVKARTFSPSNTTDGNIVVFAEVDGEY